MTAAWIADVAERKVILIVDDGDKLHTEVSLQSIFVRGVRTLTELPCKMILTYPFHGTTSIRSSMRMSMT